MHCLPIFAPRYIPKPISFKICFPFGAVFDTLSKPRMVVLVSCSYADLHKEDPYEAKGPASLETHEAPAMPRLAAC